VYYPSTGSLVRCIARGVFDDASHTDTTPDSLAVKSLWDVCMFPDRSARGSSTLAAPHQFPEAATAETHLLEASKAVSDCPLATSHSCTVLSASAESTRGSGSPHRVLHLGKDEPLEEEAMRPSDRNVQPGQPCVSDAPRMRLAARITAHCLRVAREVLQLTPGAPVPQPQVAAVAVEAWHSRELSFSTAGRRNTAQSRAATVVARQELRRVRRYVAAELCRGKRLQVREGPQLRVSRGPAGAPRTAWSCRTSPAPPAAGPTSCAPAGL
jgi:hypothetical protein